LQEMRVKTIKKIMNNKICFESDCMHARLMAGKEFYKVNIFS